MAFNMYYVMIKDSRGDLVKNVPYGRCGLVLEVASVVRSHALRLGERLKTDRHQLLLECCDAPVRLQIGLPRFSDTHSTEL